MGTEEFKSWVKEAGAIVLILLLMFVVICGGIDAVLLYCNVTLMDEIMCFLDVCSLALIIVIPIIILFLIIRKGSAVRTPQEEAEIFAEIKLPICMLLMVLMLFLVPCVW